jgi:hypothetical protein
MPAAFSFFILLMIAHFAQSITLGTLDHFSHFTLFKFLKLFAKKTQYPELRNYRAMGIPAG